MSLTDFKNLPFTRGLALASRYNAWEWKETFQWNAFILLSNPPTPPRHPVRLWRSSPKCYKGKCSITFHLERLFHLPWVGRQAGRKGRRKGYYFHLVLKPGHNNKWQFPGPSFREGLRWSLLRPSNWHWLGKALTPQWSIVLAAGCPEGPRPLLTPHQGSMGKIPKRVIGSREGIKEWRSLSVGLLYSLSLSSVPECRLHTCYKRHTYCLIKQTFCTLPGQNFLFNTILEGEAKLSLPEGWVLLCMHTVHIEVWVSALLRPLLLIESKQPWAVSGFKLPSWTPCKCSDGRLTCVSYLTPEQGHSRWRIHKETEPLWSSTVVPRLAYQSPMEVPTTQWPDHTTVIKPRFLGWTRHHTLRMH